MSILDGPTIEARPLGLLRAVIDTPSVGATTIVTGVAGKHIVVLAYVVVVSDDVTVQWLSNATALTGPMSLSANGGISVSTESAQVGALETALGQPLKINLGSPVQVSGHITYLLL